MGLGKSQGVVIRRIVSFDQDDAGDWRAWLDCGHPQHVRHQPPFINRPWVEDEAGREEKVGAELGCVRCDRFELPEGLEAYKETPEFTETSIPKGLLKDHSTKRGVWGLIRVSAGQLRYVTPQQTFVVMSGEPGIVVPEMVHHVEAQGEVRFKVEFLRRPGLSGGLTVAPTR